MTRILLVLIAVILIGGACFYVIDRQAEQRDAVRLQELDRRIRFIDTDVGTIRARTGSTGLTADPEWNELQSQRARLDFERREIYTRHPTWQAHR